MPEISVIMPVHNGEKYLREAIDSILAQTFSDFELIIIDDGSTDSTADIIKAVNDERIVYLKNENNMGISHSLNRGIAASNGQYIARMDADDISLPQRFERQIGFMKSNLEVMILGCAVEAFGEDFENTVRIFSKSNDDIKIDMLFSTPFAHPSLMFNRRVFEDDLYNSDFNGIEDYELWIRFASKYEMSTLDEVLFMYRMHVSQVTKNTNADYERKYRLLKENQIGSILADYTDEEFEAFLNYCKGNQINRVEQIVALGVFFDKILRSSYLSTENGKRNFIECARRILTNLLILCDKGLKMSVHVNKNVGLFSMTFFYKELLKKTIRGFIK